MTTELHWTESDVDNFAYRVAFDFVTHVRMLLDGGQMSQSELATRLGVSEGRVSQFLNNPGNLTLKQIVKIARAMKQKVSVVGYDDGDAANDHGPINASVFSACWAECGKPRDFFEMAQSAEDSGAVVLMLKGLVLPTQEVTLAEFSPPLSDRFLMQNLNRANASGSSNSARDLPVQSLSVN